MESILHESLPCNYELSWQNSPPAIIIRIHEDVAIKASKSSVDSEGIERLSQLLAQRNYTEDRFLPAIAGYFGFNQQLIPNRCLGENKDFIKLTAEFPSLTGTQNGGLTGWDGITTLSLTLGILFNHLNTQNSEVASEGNRKQLLTVSLDSGIKGSSRTLHGEYSPQLLSWLSKYGRYESLEDIELAMANAYFRLRGNRRASLDKFTAMIMHSAGHLKMACPGGTSLAPSKEANCQQAAKHGTGYQVVASKITSNLQLLTLLAGLAKLHDLARESIRETSTTI